MSTSIPPGASFWSEALVRSGRRPDRDSVQEVDEDRRQLSVLPVPLFDGEVDLSVLRHQDVQLASGQEPARLLTHATRVRPVIAGNDAGRHRDRAEGFGAGSDDGKVAVPDEVLAPVGHDGDEAIRV